MAKSRRKKKSDRTYLMLSGVAIAAILGVLGYVFMNPPAALQANGCLAEQQKTNSSLSILLDTTDQYRPVQLKVIKNILYERVLELKQFDHVKVYRVDELRDGILKAAINICKPGLDQLENPLFSKLKKVQFEEAIDSAFKVMEGSKPTSPIIESISSIASDMSLAHEDKEIIVVTDLIENSEIVSMYRNGWESKLKSDERYLEKTQPTLGGIRVRLLMLARPEVSTQNLDLKKWWIRFLRSSGAPKVELKEIRG